MVPVVTGDDLTLLFVRSRSDDWPVGPTIYLTLLRLFPTYTRRSPPTLVLLLPLGGDLSLLTLRVTVRHVDVTVGILLICSVILTLFVVVVLR